MRYRVLKGGRRGTDSFFVDVTVGNKHIIVSASSLGILGVLALLSLALFGLTLFV